MDAVSSDGELTLRPMVTGDFGTMARWLSDPRVLEWFGGRDRPMSYGDVRARYRPRLTGEQPTACVIAELAGRPVGYLQYYRWRDFPRDAAALRLSTLDNPYGLDLFVGEPELWGTGVGTRMLRLLLRHLFGTLGVRRVVLSTMTHNYRAQRAYAKAGFRKVRLVPAAEVHEGVARDEWVMVADRGTHRQAERAEVSS
jgi:aminoglycoside 6'-N-acetyltransferase